MKRLFVGNVDFRATEDELRELFAAYGPVDRVDIIRDSYTGKSRGFGFVDMANAEDADEAIAALNGKRRLRGRILNVSEAYPKPRRVGPEDNERRRTG